MPAISRSLSLFTSVNANLPSQCVASPLTSMSSTAPPSSSTEVKDKADVTVNRDGLVAISNLILIFLNISFNYSSQSLTLLPCVFCYFCS